MQYLHHLPKPQFLLQDEAFCENTKLNREIGRILITRDF